MQSFLLYLFFRYTYLIMCIIFYTYIQYYCFQLLLPIFEEKLAEDMTHDRRLLLGKIQALKFIKPQVQDTSLYTWGVVRRELCSKYWN